MISSLNSTWSCLCFYFSRTLPNRHWAPECVQGSPMTSKMSPKSIQDLIFSKVGHVWKEGAKKHERFNFLIPFWTFLHAQKMKCFLPWTLPALASWPPSQESSQGYIWTQKCSPKVPKWAPKCAKMITKHGFLPKWIIGVLHGKYHAFLPVGYSQMRPKTLKNSPCNPDSLWYDNSPKYPSMDPGGPPLSPFLWFCSAHFARSEKSSIL